ncbi:MAG: ComEA family DNA-binding protein [Chlamydiota bacterium]|nr:ComEA family DNA-binding protein [Chlamydiota bacterium]
MEWTKKYLMAFIVFLNLSAVLVFMVMHVGFSSTATVDLSWIEEFSNQISFDPSIKGVAEAPILNPLSIEEQVSMKEHLKININHADEKTLIDLPGVGPVLAGRIIDYRKEGHHFLAWDDLLPVKGMGMRKIEKLRDFVRFYDIENE